MYRAPSSGKWPTTPCVTTLNKFDIAVAIAIAIAIIPIAFAITMHCPDPGWVAGDRPHDTENT